MLAITNIIFEKIQAVVLAGYNVVVLEDNIFVFSEFNASTSSNASSLDFCEFKGLQITDFIINTQLSELANAKVFQRSVMNKIDSLGKPIRIQFNKYMQYVKFLT